jgi:TonB family protein
MSLMRAFLKMAVIVIGGASITFSLFILIPVMHRFFGYDLESSAGLKQHPVIQAERIVAPKKQEEQRTQRIRPVSAARSEGERGEERMEMRFTPDLSVDGGVASGDGVALQKQELGAEVFEAGQTDENAVPVYQPPVSYPSRARELGIQGTLEVIFTVNHQGKVTSVEVVKTPSPLLSTEARRTIATWRFKPARNKGIPVNVRMKQTIDFTLE